MALIVEDGTGVVGAESYQAVTAIDAYWAARPQRAEAALWDAGTSTNKEGAARGATDYVDGVWGPFFVGYQKTVAQGLLFPRIAGLDEDEEALPLVDVLGREMPLLPTPLTSAVCELAGRALTTPLSVDREGNILSKSVKMGPMAKSIEYRSGAIPDKLYGHLDLLLAPLLNGQQPNAVAATWFWL